MKAAWGFSWSTVPVEEQIYTSFESFWNIQLNTSSHVETKRNNSNTVGPNLARIWELADSEIEQ